MSKSFILFISLSCFLSDPIYDNDILLHEDVQRNKSAFQAAGGNFKSRALHHIAAGTCCQDS